MNQERDHVDGGYLAKILALLVVIAVVAIGVAGKIMGPEPALPAPRTAPRTIGSIEQTPITRTAVGLEAHDAQREALGTYGWVDRDAGIGTIPIEEAMRLVGGDR